VPSQSFESVEGTITERNPVSAHGRPARLLTDAEFDRVVGGGSKPGCVGDGHDGTL
jgi:hypothetical protein